jgi:phage repressor protein C with HTH and peptisase S24 domain
MSTLAERATEARLSTGERNVAAFARRLKVTAQAIYLIEGGKTQQLGGKLLAAYESETGYRGTWLNSGREPKFFAPRDGTEAAASAKQIQEPLHAYAVRAIDGDGDVDQMTESLVPFVDMVAGAGPGQWSPEYVETKYRMPFQRDWFRRFGAKPENVRVMRVNGASMERVLFDGDKIAVHFTLEETQIRSGNMYAFALDGEVVVKYIFRHGGGYRIVSENSDKQAYPDIFVEADAIGDRVALFGQVIDRSGSGGLFR